MGSTRKTRGRQVTQGDSKNKFEETEKNKYANEQVIEESNLIPNEDNSDTKTLKINIEPSDQFIQSHYEFSELLTTMQSEDVDQRVSEDTVTNTDLVLHDTACGWETAKTTKQSETQCPNNPPEGSLLSETGFEILEFCSHQSNVSEISEFTFVQYEGSPQVQSSQTLYSGNSEPGEDTDKDKHDIEDQPPTSDLILKPESSKESHDTQNTMTELREKTEESERSEDPLKFSDTQKHQSVTFDEVSNTEGRNDDTEQHEKSEVNHENETDLTFLTEQKKLTLISEEPLTDCAVQERNNENRSSNKEHANSPTSLEPRPETEITSVMPLYSENTEVLTQDQTETPINREPELKQFNSPHPDDVVQASQPTHVTEVQDCEPGKRRKMGSTRKTRGRQVTQGDNKETTINLHENIDEQVTVSSIITNEVGTPAKLPNALQSKAGEEQRVTKDSVKDDTDSLLQDMTFGWETAKRAKQLEAQIPNKAPEGSLLMEIEFKAKNDSQNVITAETDINALNTSLEACNYQHDSSVIVKTEDTLQVPPSVISHSQPSSPEKRRKMGSTRKTKKKPTENIQTDNRESEQDVEIISTDSKLPGTTCGSVKTTEPAEHKFSSKSPESPLLSEIELELKKDSQNLHTALPGISKQIPNSTQNTSLEACSNQSDISNLSENQSEQYEDTLQLPPSQTTYAHAEPSSPGRRRKMGSTRNTSKMKATENVIDNRENKQDTVQINTCEAYERSNEERETEELSDTVILKITKNLQESVEHHSDVLGALKDDQNITAEEQHPPSGKRKFGSRRAATGSGLGAITRDDDHTQSRKTKVEDPSSQLMICDPYFPSNSDPIQVGGRMELNQNEEEKVLVKDADVSTASGLVSLNNDRKSVSPAEITDRRKKIDFEQLNEQIPDFIQAVYNVIMVGNSNVGKTSFIRRLQNGHFSPDYNATIGVDTFVQTVTLGNRTVKLYVWDTAGQERYHSITRQVFHKAQGFLLMYDITSYESFKAIRAWISQVQEKAPDDIIMMLLGNKCDCDAREVQLSDGEDLSEEYNIHFLECSAASGENVSQSMKNLAWLLVKQRVRKEEDQTVLQPKPLEKKSGCC